MEKNKYNRQTKIFGVKGQDIISNCSVAVVGIGGIGSQVIQQLALLGVNTFTLIDNEELSISNMNRYVTIRHDDEIPGTIKVDIGERLIHRINPSINVTKIYDTIISESAFESIKNSDYVFGCLDSEGMRLFLNELCVAYLKPYFDLATDVLQEKNLIFGGRVCVVWDKQGCLYCNNIIDKEEAQLDLMGKNEKINRELLYGVKIEELNHSGPSVVSLNGVIASLGVTEFFVGITNIRKPKNLSTYRGHMGLLSIVANNKWKTCYYCNQVRGKGDVADLRRYIINSN